jgi:hypothetical protein
MSAGSLCYAAYCAAVGGTTFNDQPLPTFDELGDRQKAGWEAAADNGGFAAARGDELLTDAGIKGVVTTMQNGRSGRGYWIEGADTTGRPFEHYVDDRSIAGVNGTRPAG